ncbi:MAG: hypothetical protein HZB85_01850 [Deltaproteobacteria bacterium]|nr:hypothetical protein [Deltaproteobacteria bacterium]
MEILVKQDFESPAHGRMLKGTVREVEDVDGRAFIRAGLAEESKPKKPAPKSDKEG